MLNGGSLNTVWAIQRAPGTESPSRGGREGRGGDEKLPLSLPNHTFTLLCYPEVSSLEHFHCATRPVVDNFKDRGTQTPWMTVFVTRGGGMLMSISSQHFPSWLGKRRRNSSAVCHRMAPSLGQGASSLITPLNSPLGANGRLCSLASHPHPHLSPKPGNLAGLQNPKHRLFP